MNTTELLLWRKQTDGGVFSDMFASITQNVKEVSRTAVIKRLYKVLRGNVKGMALYTVSAVQSNRSSWSWILSADWQTLRPVTLDRPEGISRASALLCLQCTFGRPLCGRICYFEAALRFLFDRRSEAPCGHRTCVCHCLLMNSVFKSGRRVPTSTGEPLTFSTRCCHPCVRRQTLGFCRHPSSICPPRPLVYFTDTRVIVWRAPQKAIVIFKQHSW